MNLTRPLMLAAVLTLASAAMGVWAYVNLPTDAVFPMNYGLDGRPHSFLPKAEGLAVMPLISALLTAVLTYIPTRAHNKEGLFASADAYGLLLTGLAALFLVAQGALIAQAFDPTFDVLRWVFLAAAVLLVLVGNSLGKIRQNDKFGIRTRWTLADARVWDKTHRFAGRAMVLAAAALAALTYLASDRAVLIAGLVIAAAGPPLAAVLYSAMIPPAQQS
jgi:immunity protein, SdpI family